MPLFRYRAYSKTGAKLTGVIDADSSFMAKERLRNQELIITFLGVFEKGHREVAIESAQLLSFTRELSQLLTAGLPLYESLVTIEEKYRGTKSHPLFLDLCDSIKSGSSLSQALRKYPKSFDTIYLSLVSAAEQTASLSQVFDQLSNLIDKQQKLRKKLTSSLAYPGFLGVFCFLVVCGLIFFVIPSMQELFEGRRLHPVTYCVMTFSKWMNTNLSMLATGIAGLIGGLFFIAKSRTARAWIQKKYLNIPFFRSLIIHSGLIRFFQSCSMLISGGVPLLESIVLSKKVIRQFLLEDIIEKAEMKMMEGLPLSSQLAHFTIIPKLVPRMLSIAEETGNMAEMMRNIAEIYEEEMEKNLSLLTTFLQPALLIVLGAIVGIVVLSILLPLTDVSSFLST